MSYKGRIVTFSLVLFINSIYITYYYFRDGTISWIEIIGLPIMLAIAWRFGKHYDDAKFYSEKGPLTGIYNRRVVDPFFTKMEVINDRYEQKLAIFIIDIDNFKMINDHYGHKEGDQLLKQLAAELINSVRKTDIVARWGGDEFLILSPDIKRKENALEIIERINKNINNISTPNIEIKVSVGAAVYPNEGNSFDELIRLADKNMYNMKIEHFAK